MLIDSVKIKVKAGDGGGGCNSFYKDKLSRYGKADGGDGGKGGDIVIRADRNLFTLYDFKYRKYFKADNGGNAFSNQKKGRSGLDKVIAVPPGTTIIDSLGNNRIKELIIDGQEIIVAKGGEGGKGSKHAKSEEDLKGVLGEEKDLILDLRLIADVGLVGFPNSGKSTLLSKVTGAHPKIANFPFTTKDPILGMAELDDTSFCIADIPGLIEGSHSGRGLGDRFLRHIERTKLLVQVIDMASCDGRNPWDDFRIINKEIKLYGGGLFKKPKIIVANKMDLAESKDNLTNFKKKIRQKIIQISALKAEGLEELLDAIKENLVHLSN